MVEVEEVKPNDERVYSLMRLAIASEYNKRGLKREDIIEKVCASLRKAPVFRQVLEHANTKLETEFSYQLVPLPVVSGPAVAAAKTSQSKKAAVNQSNKITNSKNGPPQMFILVSKLSPEKRALIPRNCRDAVSLAVTHTILMTIILSGNLIEHHQLISALNEVQICRQHSPVLPQKDLEGVLEQLRKEKYILKDRKSVTDPESVYSWGPRAFIEFPPNRMADFLHKVATTNNKEELEPKFKEKVEKVLKIIDE